VLASTGIETLLDEGGIDLVGYDVGGLIPDEGRHVEKLP
jgi:hypothetical protein